MTDPLKTADGSRTDIVDLTQVAIGTTVNMSFDLIGFATNGSQVSIRDVKMLASPNVAPVAAVSATVRGAEDQPLNIAVLLTCARCHPWHRTPE